MTIQSSNEPPSPLPLRPLAPLPPSPAPHPIQSSNEPSSPPHPLHPSPRWTTLLLLIVALIPRLPGLNRFLTSDENTNIFIAGSDVIAAFLRGDLRGTYWHFYPGVTMSWLDAIGMGTQYLFDSLSGATLLPFNEYIYNDILSLVLANRLPYAILSGLTIPAIYLLSRQLLPHRIALLGAFFLAFDPFYLAHSRVAHGDAPVATFMTLSALSFFIYAQNNTSWIENKSANKPIAGRMRQTLTRPYLIASAILGSLAALTKAPGQFMVLFIMGISLLYTLQQIRLTTKSQAAPLPLSLSLKTIIIHWFVVIIAWGLISLFIFILLWPSMWVDPIGTFRQMLAETFSKVNQGHLVYFLGQPTLDPGPWFYSYVIPFRMTPIILLGCLLSLLLFIPKIKAMTNHQSPQLFSPLFLLWLFTFTLLIFGNLSPKKQDRYLLPLFPFLNLIAAIGWVGLINLLFYLSKSKISPLQPPIFNLSLTLLVFLHAIPVLTYYPYYLTYFNPLLGGPARATETTLLGWGEGMEQAAAYLNTKPDAQNLYVASTPSQTLLPYFAGHGENFYTNDIALRADYVVIYLAQRQRLAPSPEIVRYFETQEPEKVIFIQDIPYAKIYPGPKLILSDIPLQATPANMGLDNVIRLAGYQLPPAQTSLTNNQINQISLTLYWHALIPPPTDYTISVRARTAAGQVVAQQDQWPVAGLLPTTQWRQGDYITDNHTLDLPNLSQISTFEIVVYDATTSQTLGPPLIIDN